MARRHNGSFPGRVRSRRATQWNLGPGGQTGSGFTGSLLDILGSGVEPATEKVTIVRIRGELMIQLATVSAADEGFVWTYGIGIVSADAFAVGASAVPNPQDDMDWPWMYHGFTQTVAPTGTLADIGSASVVRIPVDVKAMRILDLNQTLFMAIDALELGTATADVFFDSRIFLKLF